MGFSCYFNRCFINICRSNNRVRRKQVCNKQFACTINNRNNEILRTNLQDNQVINDEKENAFNEEIQDEISNDINKPINTYGLIEYLIHLIHLIHLVYLKDQKEKL